MQWHSCTVIQLSARRVTRIQVVNASFDAVFIESMVLRVCIMFCDNPVINAAHQLPQKKIPFIYNARQTII